MPQINANKQAKTRKKRERDFADSSGVKAAAPDDIPEDEQGGETLFEPTTEETPMAGEGLDCEQLEHALSELPEKQRSIVLACECYGRDHQEVADELGMTVSEVEQSKQKGLAQLRYAMTPKGAWAIG